MDAGRFSAMPRFDSLIFINKGKPDNPYLLKNPATVIGSARTCDIEVPLSSIEPQHFVLQKRNGKVHLSSRCEKTILVNSQAVPSTGIELNNGDMISFGGKQARFELAGPVVSGPRRRLSSLSSVPKAQKQLPGLPVRSVSVRPPISHIPTVSGCATRIPRMNVGRQAAGPSPSRLPKPGTRLPMARPAISDVKSCADSGLGSDRPLSAASSGDYAPPAAPVVKPSTPDSGNASATESDPAVDVPPARAVSPQGTPARHSPVSSRLLDETASPEVVIGAGLPVRCSTRAAKQLSSAVSNTASSGAAPLSAAKAAPSRRSGSAKKGVAKTAPRPTAADFLKKNFAKTPKQEAKDGKKEKMTASGSKRKRLGSKLSLSDSDDSDSEDALSRMVARAFAMPASVSPASVTSPMPSLKSSTKLGSDSSDNVSVADAAAAAVDGSDLPKEGAATSQPNMLYTPKLLFGLSRPNVRLEAATERQAVKRQPMAALRTPPRSAMCSPGVQRRSRRSPGGSLLKSKVLFSNKVTVTPITRIGTKSYLKESGEEKSSCAGGDHFPEEVTLHVTAPDATPPQTPTTAREVRLRQRGARTAPPARASVRKKLAIVGEDDDGPNRTPKTAPRPKPAKSTGRRNEKRVAAVTPRRRRLAAEVDTEPTQDDTIQNETTAPTASTSTLAVVDALLDHVSSTSDTDSAKAGADFANDRLTRRAVRGIVAKVVAAASPGAKRKAELRNVKRQQAGKHHAAALGGLKPLFGAADDVKSGATPVTSGVKELMRLSVDSRTPTPRVGAIRRLIRSARRPVTPQVRGVRPMFSSARQHKQRQSPRVAGIKRLMSTPGKVVSPKVVGVKRLMQSAVEVKVASPDVTGVKPLLRQSKKLEPVVDEAISKLFDGEQSAGPKPSGKRAAEAESTPTKVQAPASPPSKKTRGTRRQPAVKAEPAPATEPKAVSPPARRPRRAAAKPNLAGGQNAPTGAKTTRRTAAKTQKQEPEPVPETAPVTATRTTRTAPKRKAAQKNAVESVVDDALTKPAAVAKTRRVAKAPAQQPPSPVAESSPIAPPALKPKTRGTRKNTRANNDSGTGVNLAPDHNTSGASTGSSKENVAVPAAKSRPKRGAKTSPSVTDEKKPSAAPPARRGRTRGAAADPASTEDAPVKSGRTLRKRAAIR